MDLWGVGVVVLVFVLNYYIWIGHKNNFRHLINKGIQANARIAGIKPAKARAAMNPNTKQSVKMLLEINPNRKVVIQHTFEAKEPRPVKGDMVNILIDPKKPDNIILSPAQNYKKVG